LQRGRDVRVRELANVFRGDHVDHAGRLALHVQVALQGTDEAGDDDLLEILGLGGAGRRGLRRRRQRDR
jgi:hypothetical protein